MLDILLRSHELLNGFKNGFEIRPRNIHTVPGPLELCCRYQFHGLCDLHGGVDALNFALYIARSHSCHYRSLLR